MAIDGIFIHYLLTELKPDLINARIEKIGAHKNIFTFSIYTKGQKKNLVFDLNASNCALYFGKNSDSTSTTPFITTLKKCLEFSIIKDVNQYKSDRIVIFDLQKVDYLHGLIEYQLVFEMMGKHANLILLNNNVIIDCYKKGISETGRSLVPHMQFEHFYTDKLDASDYQFDASLTPKEITNKYLGISLATALYLVDTHLHPFNIKVAPSLYENRLYFYQLSLDNYQPFNSLSELCNYKTNDTANAKQIYLTFIQQQIKRLAKKITQLQDQLLLNSNYHDLQAKGNLLYSSNLPLDSKLASYHDIILDPLLTINQNAQKLFKQYHKQKRSITHLTKQLEINQNSLNILTHYQSELALTEVKDLNQFDSLLALYGFKKKVVLKKKPTRPTIFTLQDESATYYVGKNALQNEYLVFSFAKANDWWFHVQSGPGGHVVVQTDELNEGVLRTAAKLAAYHSPQTQSSSIPINYTKIRNIKKIPGYPGSFVRYSNEKTIYIDLDEDIKDFISQNTKKGV